MAKYHNLMVETKEQEETWMVTPTPGYILKFKEAVRIGHSQKTKVFVNICHCSQLPPPTDDIDEDELAAKIDKEDFSFRIPLSVGELECVSDKGGETSAKVDVLVNNVFFDKRLAPTDAEFYRHYLAMVVCGAIEKKHDLVMNPNDAIRLKNRKKMGDLGPMRIYKRSPAPVVEEIYETVLTAETPKESLFTAAQPSNVKIRLLGGEKLEIHLGLDEVQPPVRSGKRLRLKLGVDRVLILVDNQRSLFDFCIPFNIDPSLARSKLVVEKNCLIISVPTVFS